MLYLVEMPPTYCPSCGLPFESKLRTPQDRDLFYNVKKPYPCECLSRYRVIGDAVYDVFSQSVRDSYEIAEGADNDVRYLTGRTKILSELYIILGELDAPMEVLDQVLAAIEGSPLPHESLIPFRKA